MYRRNPRDTFRDDGRYSRGSGDTFCDDGRYHRSFCDTFLLGKWDRTKSCDPLIKSLSKVRGGGGDESFFARIFLISFFYIYSI